MCVYVYCHFVRLHSTQPVVIFLRPPTSELKVRMLKPTNYARGVLQSLNIEFQCMVPYGTQKSMIILDLMSNTKPGFWRVILRAVGL